MPAAGASGPAPSGQTTSGYHPQPAPAPAVYHIPGVSQIPRAIQSAHSPVYHIPGVSQIPRAVASSRPPATASIPGVSQVIAQQQHQAALNLLRDSMFPGTGLGSHKGLSLSIPDVYTHGHGGLMGAIEGLPVVGSIASIAPGLAKLGKNFASDAINLPGQTLQGAEQLGSAIFDDLTHGRLGNSNYNLQDPANRAETPKVLGQAIHASMLGHLGRGDLSGAWKTFEQHPLYSAQELAGGYGLAGRAAGAIGRSGLLGADAARVAGTAREARTLAPGLPGDVQHYSKNLLTKGAQVAVENHPALQKALYNATGRSVGRAMNKRVDEFKALADNQLRTALHTTGQKLKDAMPQDKAAAAVVPHAVMGTAGSRDAFLAGLDAQAQRLKLAEQSGTLTPAGLRANRQHQADLAKFVTDPKAHDAINSIFNASHDYTTRQNALDAELARHGLLVSAQAEQRAVMPYAITNMGARIDDKGVLSPRHDYHIQSQADLKAAQASHDQAALDHAVTSKSAGDSATALKAAEQKLARARVQEQRTYGILLGRHGGTAPLNPDAVARMNSYLDATHSAELHLANLKAAHAASQTELKQMAADRLAAAKDTLNDAHQTAADAKQYAGDRVTGLVTDTPTGPRHLSADEVKQHMAANGVDPAAYIKLAPPSNGMRNVWAKYKLTRGGSKGPKFKGTSITTGAYAPGYGVLGQSQLGTVAKLERAKANDAFIRENGIQNPATGTPFDLVNAQKFAEQYQQEHGITLVPMYAHPKAITDEQLGAIRAQQAPTTAAQTLLDSRKVPTESGQLPVDHASNNVVLVPKPMLDRYEKHMKVDSSGNALVSAANRQFRNTVLPTSTKWIAGNVIEAALRAALVGAHPGTARLANQVIKEARNIDPEAAARFEAQTTGGLHMAMHERNMDDIGAKATSGPTSAPQAVASAVRNAPVVKQMGDAYHYFTQKVFAFNHALESYAEKGVLGVHMRQQMHEMAGSWGQAITATEKYRQELAKGYLDPRLAADASRYIRQTLGQYDQFSPGMRQLTRSIAPFLPWYLNSAKFIYHTMPIGHPVTQALLTDVSRAYQKDWAAQHNVPHGSFGPDQIGDLLSAVKTGPSDFYNLGRYTPAGAFTSGPIDYTLNALLPQVQGAYKAALGQDPFGNPLKDAAGKKITDTRTLGASALSNLLSGFTGPLGPLQRVAEGGSTAVNSNKLWDWPPQTKPGTEHPPPFGLPNVGVLAGFNKVFNPFEPTHLGKGSPGGTPSGGSTDWQPLNLNTSGSSTWQKVGALPGVANFATAISPGQPGPWAPRNNGPGNIPGVAQALGGVENVAYTAQVVHHFAAATQKAATLPANVGSVIPGLAEIAKLKAPAGVQLSGPVANMIALMNTITANHYNYQWGGGHSQIGAPSGGPGTGFDCSGVISAILHAAGVQQAPMVAADYMSYGQPGPGTKPNDITIYASQGHVFSQIGGKFFGTSGSNPGGGAGWFSSADTSGFVARHITIPANSPITPQVITAAMAGKTTPGPPGPLLGTTAPHPAPFQNAALQNVPATLGKLFVEAGKKYNIPPAVLAGVAQIETSMGTNRSTSSAGAQGLMQFMPGTAASHGVDPYNDRSSVLGAAKLLNEYGYQSNPLRALGAYNGGPGNPQYSYANQVMAAAKGFGGGAGNISAAAQTGSSGSASALSSSGAAPGRSSGATTPPDTTSAASVVSAIPGLDPTIAALIDALLARAGRPISGSSTVHISRIASEPSVKIARSRL